MRCGKYCNGNEEPIDNLFFVTGACRSGKTLFSKILASTQNTEWIEEPYELSLLLWAIQAGKSSADLEWEEKAFNAICKELINSAILLRNGNFRPEDLSTIWNYKEAKEIFRRLVNINTRNQVQDYIKENNSHFIIDIPGILGSSEFMKKACKGLSIIHVMWLKQCSKSIGTQTKVWSIPLIMIFIESLIIKGAIQNIIFRGGLRREWSMIL